MDYYIKIQSISTKNVIIKLKTRIKHCFNILFVELILYFSTTILIIKLLNLEV